MFHAVVAPLLCSALPVLLCLPAGLPRFLTTGLLWCHDFINARKLAKSAHISVCSLQSLSIKATPTLGGSAERSVSLF